MVASTGVSFVILVLVFSVIGRARRRSDLTACGRCFSMCSALESSAILLVLVLVNQEDKEMDLQESMRNPTHVSILLTTHLLSKKAQASNIAFSPLSIQVILSLVAAGSKGQTLDQSLSFLKSSSINDLNKLYSQLLSPVFADGSHSGGPYLAFANGVWVEKTLLLKHSFKKVVNTVYKAASNHVDFQNKAVGVANEVNSWVKRQTNGLIEEILPIGAVDSSTRLILANALYFKGAWTQKFDESKTRNQDFYLLNGSMVKAPFMTSKKKQLLRAYDGFKVLSLPYKQGQDKRHFSMCFFLPDARDGLPALVGKICSEPNFLERHIPHQEVNVGQFLIPKFKFAFGFEASQLLKDMGLVLPFSGEEGLTEMVDPPLGNNLYVSSIYHKSFIEVNEEGTEAAAASAGMVMFKSASMPEQEIDFVADHPFFFFIKEDTTGALLFVGQITNPQIA